MSDPESGEYLNPWIADMGPEALRRAVEVFQTDTSPLIEQMREVVRDETYFGLWLLQADASLRAGSGLSVFDLDSRWL